MVDGEGRGSSERCLKWGDGGWVVIKGNFRSKKSYAQMKEREKCKKNEPSPTSMRQMVLEIFHFKLRNLSNMEVTIL